MDGVAGENTAGVGLSARVRCIANHHDNRNWLTVESHRPGWLRTTCKACGRFIGYLPKHVAQKAEEKLARRAVRATDPVDEGRYDELVARQVARKRKRRRPR